MPLSKSLKIQIPYAVRFRLHNHSLADVSIMPIEQINRQSQHVFNHRESYAIAKLFTPTPNDINVDE